MTLTAMGIAFGSVGAFTVTRLMTRLLFNITPQDPVTFIAVPLFSQRWRQSRPIFQADGQPGSIQWSLYERSRTKLSK